MKPSVFLVCCPEECRRRKRLTSRQAGSQASRQQRWKHGHGEDRGGPHVSSPLSKNRKTRLDYWLHHTLGESNTSMITRNSCCDHRHNRHNQECRTSLPAVKQTRWNQIWNKSLSDSSDRKLNSLGGFQPNLWMQRSKITLETQDRTGVFFCVKHQLLSFEKSINLPKRKLRWGVTAAEREHARRCKQAVKDQRPELTSPSLVGLSCTLLIAGCPSFGPAVAHFHFHVAHPHTAAPPPPRPPHSSIPHLSSRLHLPPPFYISFLTLIFSPSSLLPLSPHHPSVLADHGAIRWFQNG